MIVRIAILLIVLGLVAGLAWWLWGPGSLERELRKRTRKAAHDDFEREVRRWD